LAPYKSVLFDDAVGCQDYITLVVNECKYAYGVLV